MGKNQNENSLRENNSTLQHHRPAVAANPTANGYAFSPPLAPIKKPKTEHYGLDLYT